MNYINYVACTVRRLRVNVGKVSLMMVIFSLAVHGRLLGVVEANVGISDKSL